MSSCSSRGDSSTSRYTVTAHGASCPCLTHKGCFYYITSCKHSDGKVKVGGMLRFLALMHGMHDASMDTICTVELPQGNKLAPSNISKAHNAHSPAA